MLVTRVISSADEKELWFGDLPIVNKGQRINHRGVCYRVLDAAVGLEQGSPGRGIAVQSVIVEVTDE